MGARFERRSYSSGLATGANQVVRFWQPRYPDAEGPDGSGAGALGVAMQAGYLTTVKARLNVDGLTLSSFRVIIARPITLAQRDTSNPGDVVYDPVILATTYPERVIYDSGAVTAGLTDGSLPVDDALTDESATFDGPYVIGVVTSATGVAGPDDMVTLEIGSREC